MSGAAASKYHKNFPRIYNSNCSNTHRIAVVTVMEEQQKWSGEDGPNPSCASRHVCSALGLLSFIAALVKAFCETHCGAAHISITKHTECRSHVRDCKYKILAAAIFVRFRSAP